MSNHGLLDDANFVPSLDTFYDLLAQGEITAGMVLIFRYQGPKGAPGMPEMLGENSSYLFFLRSR